MAIAAALMRPLRPVGRLRPSARQYPRARLGRRSIESPGRSGTGSSPYSRPMVSDISGDETPRPTDGQVEIEPWHAVWSDSGSWPGQPERLEELRRTIGAAIGDRVFIARSADVVCHSLSIGNRSYVAAGCQLRDRVRIGEDCSLNPHVTMAGAVTLGNGVRVASHAAFYGFNHVFADLDTPIWLQGLVEEGIVVEDD